MSDVVLSVRGLSVGYGGPPIVQDVSLEAREGAITALVGPNGAGKSTLLKGIAGVLRPSAGTISIGGESVAGLPPEQLVRRGLAYVPQVANVFRSLSVLENLEMGAYGRRGSPKARIEEMFTLFPDLRAAAKRPARTLSGGQRNMLALARGLMASPRVLLIDEPTAGLAPRYEAAVWEHVLAVRATGVAVVVVEQNTRRTLGHADWAYLLTLGRVRIEGSGSSLLQNKEVVELYIGGASTTLASTAS
ncbi:MAG: ABC transporter ATP-binding protein [Candidatus Limnocylindrales bacterium]